MSKPFQPIKAPKRTPRPPPPISAMPPTAEEIRNARTVLRRVLLEQRWDLQGGYSSRRNGKWQFVTASLGQLAPKEFDALFAFAGIVPDEIETVGDCADCANSDDGRERGYSAPCSSCLRPSHINNFVPIKNLKRNK
jgi:hypothetical protein